MSQQAITTPTDITPLEHYILVRQQIEHEDNLVGQRISWFVAAQSFFFSAYAIVTSNLHPDGPRSISPQSHWLFNMIPLLGIANCIIISGTVVAGMKAMRNLRDGYEAWLTTSKLSAPRGIPPVQGKRITQIFGQAGPRALPPVFMVVWMILLIHGWVM